MSSFGGDNNGHNGVTHGGSYPAGGYGAEDDDFSGAAEHASRHAGDSGDSSLFSTLLGALTQKKQSLADQDVDEDDAVKQHQKLYKDDDGDEVNDRSLGSAAAMQALKLFTGGDSGSSQQGNSQSAFIGTAMAEASKLFDQKASQGKVSGDSSKESAIMQAGEMALKMYMKSRGGGAETAGSSSSGLLSLASKFMK
ncbi:hypothetical protein PG999_001014 [Apiospora kogelbergensis]|uniref:DUF7721 domain-containing protein n=1 Tax=Apiospora kogelbergensis TaxID=1337665 RepID=A0AAW0RDK3_9PEZI